jgi:hypothetical protein
VSVVTIIGGNGSSASDSETTEIREPQPFSELI